MDDSLALNRAWWDERAQLHGQDAHYDVDGFLRGASSLTPREVDELEAAVGSVTDLDLLHLQCHFGLDTLSWVRMGARATGVDFSPVAIAKAKEVANRTGLQAEFVEADVQDLPSDLAGRFDVVFASEGVFCWIRDVARWMSSAFTALRPGGRLVVLDKHPLLHMLASADPLTFDAPYQGSVATTYDSPGSYASPDAPTVANVCIEYSHGLGEIVTAAAGAGFDIDSVTEWLDDTRGPGDRRLTKAEDGSFRFRVGGYDLPCCFSLRATKPRRRRP